MSNNPSLDCRGNIGIRHLPRSCHVSYDNVVFISLTQGQTSGNCMAIRRKYEPDRRELIQNVTGDWFAKRRPDGRFRSMDERGPSIAADIRQTARRVVPSGFGDIGDQRRRRK